MNADQRKTDSEDGAERLLRELESQAIEHGARPLDVVMLRDRVALGATLLSLRIARGLSQHELSQISGVEQADISRIERANVDLRASTLLRLLAGLAAHVTFELEDDSQTEGVVRAETHGAYPQASRVRAMAFESERPSRRTAEPT